MGHFSETSSVMRALGKASSGMGMPSRICPGRAPLQGSLKARGKGERLRIKGLWLFRYPPPLTYASIRLALTRLGSHTKGALQVIDSLVEASVYAERDGIDRRVRACASTDGGKKRVGARRLCRAKSERSEKTRLVKEVLARRRGRRGRR